MRYSNPAPVDNTPAIRRFMTMLTLDPGVRDPRTAILFWCVTGALVFSLLVGGLYALVTRGNIISASYVQADLQDAPLQTATVVVQAKTPWDRATKLNPMNSGVVLNVNIAGKPATTPDVPDERAFGVRVGDPILVKYRVGKSHRVYIEDWQPQH